jgi:aminopeptidase N
MGSSPATAKAKRAVQKSGAGRVPPELRQLVRDASRALALLDAERLEEMAASCAALSRDLASREADQRVELASQAREAAEDMAVFARVLDATRANLTVMNRLRELNGERLEYGEGQVRGWVGAEGSHGDH